MKTLCGNNRIAVSKALRRCCGWSKDAMPAAIERWMKLCRRVKRPQVLIFVSFGICIQSI
jgi:hypothetical protein